MKQYNLQALLTMRARHKEAAEQTLQHAVVAHQSEQTKLQSIETSLRDAISSRMERQNNFFHKALRYSSSKTEIACHVASNHKTMCDEINLRKALKEQEAMVQVAFRNVELARNAAIDAHRNLKVIEKHHLAWQRGIIRAEEIKEEHESDDQSTVRFLLKRA